MRAVEEQTAKAGGCWFEVYVFGVYRKSAECVCTIIVCDYVTYVYVCGGGPTKKQRGARTIINEMKRKKREYTKLERFSFRDIFFLNIYYTLKIYIYGTIDNIHNGFRVSGV